MSSVTQTLFAQALARETGLSYTASLAWSTAEVGSLNNLGIMSGGHPVSYPTPSAGAKAAAALIASSSYYAGIRASVGRSAQAQMDAIARSPWHLGPSGLAAAGGIDPYYVRVFKGFGYVPSSGGGSSSGSETVATGDEVYYRLLKQKFGTYVGRTYGAIINGGPYAPWDAIPDTFRGFMAKLGRSEGDVFTDADLRAIAGAYEALPGNQPLDIPGAIAAVPGAIVQAAVPVLVNAVPLILIIVLAYSGLRDVLGESP